MRKIMVVCVLALFGCGSGSTAHDAGTAGKTGSAGSGTAGTGGNGTAGATGGTGGDGTAGGGTAGTSSTAGTGGGSAGTGGSTAGTGGGTAGTGGGTAGAGGGTAGAGGGTAGAGGKPADGGAGADAGDASADKPIDAPADVASEAGSDAHDAGSDVSSDAGTDVPPACTVANTACDLGTTDGLCKANVCAACTDVTDDAHCTSAYGSATNPYLCLGGSCVPGNCRTNANCATPAGSICGLSKANTCAKCASDAQCMTAYGATFICTTSGTGAGACVAGTCGGADNTMCSANASDVCCGSACAAGECCPGTAGDTLCKNKLGNSAVCTTGHACSTCQTVTGKDYLVDPVNGSDSGSTGSATPTKSCSFKTITRALQFIGPGAVAGTTITIVGGATAGAAVVVKAGEDFPIVVPANVTIVGKDFVTVSPPAGDSGFQLSAAASGLKNLLIDGGNHAAESGVVVIAGSTDGTTLQDVDVANFLGDGIVVQGGILTIGAGVTSTGNGVPGARASGLHVSNGTAAAGAVHINLPATQVAFNGNSASGIVVDGTSSVTIHGVPGTGGAGTVVANSNAQNGIVINQSGAAPHLNTLSGVVAWANMGTNLNGQGLAISGGSNVQVRSSYLLSNNNAGVFLLASNGNTDVTKVDLGTAQSSGKNTLQASLGSGQNVNGGICMNFNPGSAAQLTAMGNIFSGARDCSTATPGALTGGRGATCANHVDVAFAGASNDILVANCTKP